MGILSRFSDIMKSNINAMLDKMEDPGKMIDQTLLNLRSDLAKVKSETAGVMADAKNSRRRVEEKEAEIAKYLAAAQNALKAGNEDDARKLIAQKQQSETSLASLQQAAELAEQNAQNMRAMHDKLTNDIAALEARRDGIQAKAAVAKAQESVNKMIDGGTKAAASIETFDRLEAKVDKKLDKAMAHAELNSGITATSDLAEKYTGGKNNMSVDDELAALKASLNAD